MPQPSRPDDHAPLTPAVAVQVAALLWAAMLVLLLAVFVFTLVMTLPATKVATSPSRSDTFIPVSIATVMIIAASSFTHWYLFRAYWKDGLVLPKGWLLASIILYSGITLCAILALVGAIIDGSFFPNVMVAAMVVLLLMATWPSGRAMRVRRPRGEEDDDVELFHLPPEDEQEER
ncbi:MAG: hypothetical protein WD009_08725 [Phycisphaeraceae bacterium]